MGARLALAALVLLAACAETGRLAPLPGEVARSTGTFAEGVDGLTVGHRLMAAGEFEAALKAYNRAAAEERLEGRPISVDALSAIGSATLRLGRLGQAERIFRQAIELDERFVPAWNNLGVTLELRGDFAEAREAFRNAFLLDSGLTPEIADNLNRIEAKIEGNAAAPPEESDFRLVRRGNGRYLLLGNN